MYCKDALSLKVGSLALPTTLSIVACARSWTSGYRISAIMSVVRVDRV